MVLGPGHSSREGKGKCSADELVSLALDQLLDILMSTLVDSNGKRYCFKSDHTRCHIRHVNLVTNVHNVKDVTKRMGSKCRQLWLRFPNRCHAFSYLNKLTCDVDEM